MRHSRDMDGPGGCRAGRGAVSGGRAIRQAVVLAGGFGRRMRPLTFSRPKPMVEVHGTPILRHQIDWFAECGVEQVVVAAGHRAQVIKDYVASQELPLRTDVVAEERPLGRGGGLKRAAATLARPDEPWLAAYGDIWTRFSLTDMYAHHRRHAAPATVALARPWLPRGSVDCDEQGRVSALASKAPPQLRVNAGIYIFEPQVIELLPDEGDHEDSALAHLVRTRRLMGYPFDGPWRAINTPRDLEDLERELAAQAANTTTTKGT
ncbi:nucleotidyltransferase family protein [Streptomyces pinistramenti]|uniref:nucleotidyltransferase family protein n=1 Tax=Streptomyces pinistramenti TaxID=2884812 RepID=UPI001D0659FA|nr:nucleotidyltransferase family protein [Streptomyces pinistramenti]MCB5909032.1 nucleotidyltransferase family protein [Streptomyces pinistramenti]